MAFGEQHVLGFSPDGKLFALINDQGILRIWDTDTNELKQEYTPNLHLSGPCSALVWITVSTAASAIKDKKGKKARKSSESSESLYIALGTSKGQVSLYSYAEAKIERSLKGEGHNGKITSIIRDTEGHLYTCGEDCQVIVWSLAEEKQLKSWSVGPEKPFSISLMPTSKSLVVGSRSLKVYSTDREELVQTFTGHTSEINLMAQFVSNDGSEYVLTTSRMERIICLWKIGKKGRNKPAACTLLMEDIAHCLTCHIDDENTLRVSSVTRSGVIHVYVLDIDSIKADKPLKPKVTISIASDSTTVIEPITAVAASLQHSTKQGELLFAYGDKHVIVFEQLKPSFNEKMQVLVRKDPRKQAKQQLIGKRNEIGSEKALKMITPIIDTKDVDYKSSIAVTNKKLKPLDMPMEARLQNLNLNVGEGKVVPQAQSKVQLLVQSLHSKDETLLRSVLCTKDMKTIQLTLQKLPVQYVGTLVNELTLLMQQRHTNVEYAMNWLKVLAQTHSSQLMALGAEDLLNKFGPCIGIIEHRANCLKELSKLNGRLQLLVSQIKRNNEQDQDNLKSDNVLVFEDNDDSSTSDLDDAINKSSSDDEWEEGEEDDEDDQKNGGESMDQDDDDDDDMDM
ncbi:WD repeat-containing protein 43 [Musca vetustissima]|uniref:WD repeat-containing protein 43 n=1 Tax=Musca vetustissima TaxID=27455 RepID=UPI002AB72D78|nr:WD repeat-containing protein 43 [Musca vetustissima]